MLCSTKTVVLFVPISSARHGDVHMPDMPPGKTLGCDLHLEMCNMFLSLQLNQSGLPPHGIGGTGGGGGGL